MVGLPDCLRLSSHFIKQRPGYTKVGQLEPNYLSICTVLRSGTLYSTAALHCTALHLVQHCSSALQGTALHLVQHCSSALQDTALHCTAPCTALQHCQSSLPPALNLEVSHLSQLSPPIQRIVLYCSVQQCVVVYMSLYQYCSSMQQWARLCSVFNQLHVKSKQWPVYSVQCVQCQCILYSVYSVECLVCTVLSVHSVHCTVSTVYSVKCIWCSVCMAYTVQCPHCNCKVFSVYSSQFAQCTVYNVKCVRCSVCMAYTVQCPQCIVFSVYSVQCAQYTVSIVYIIQC